VPLNVDYLRSVELPPIRTVVSDRDAMFYALSIGLARDPLDRQDLRYAYEADLKTFPTMPLIIGHPGNWMSDPRTGVTRSKVVHGGQRLTVHQDVPINTPLLTTNRVVNMFDKGDQGAILVIERDTCIEATGERISLSETHVFCRADGNFGGAPGPIHEFETVPDRPADCSISTSTDRNMALMYRLNHDRNPLHADPDYAMRAGFDQPILHGLATYGVAAVAVAKAFPDRTITSFDARFSKPVFPGETISVDIWDELGKVHFRARIEARNVVVLDRGSAGFRDEAG
jgi:acyl dehydratase